MDQGSSLLAVISTGADICRVAVDDNGAVIAGLFLTGLVGSATHCTGMCGPFALSQMAARLERIPAREMRESDRWWATALIPYHLGRATTYALLGAVAAGAAGSFAGWGGFRWLAAALLALAALFVAGMALPRLKARLGGGGWWSRIAERVASPLFSNPTGWRGWALGVTLGFIPCGLLYAAVAAAAATGDALGGAFAMLAFSAGTVPVLVAVAAAGQMAMVKFRAPLTRWSPLLLALNSGVLAFMAWRMVA